jgi:hypothetical protein
LATTATQAWAALQYVPATQSVLAAQVALQVPCESQMLDWHCWGAWQAWPAGLPQVPDWQVLPAHWASAVQLAPPGAFTTQVPLTQALVARQLASLVQLVLQAPAVQVLLRQALALVQAPGVGVPQVPLAQTPEPHWEAPVQAPPLGSLAEQLPSRQARPWAQVASVAHDGLQR